MLNAIADFVRQLSLRFPTSRMNDAEIAAWVEELTPLLDPAGLNRLRAELVIRHDRMPPLSSIVSAARDLGVLRALRVPQGAPRVMEELREASCPHCGTVMRWTEEAWIFPGGRTVRTVPSGQQEYAEARAMRQIGLCRTCDAEKNALTDRALVKREV